MRRPAWPGRPAAGSGRAAPALAAALAGWLHRQLARGLAGPAALSARLDAEIRRGLPELAVHVLPFTHPQVVQVLAAAQPPERRAGQMALPLAQVVPQVEEGEEVRSRLREPCVHLVRGLPCVGGPLPRVDDGQRRGDDQHLADAAVPGGLQDHPAEPRVERQPGQLAAHLGQPGAAPARVVPG